MYIHVCIHVRWVFVTPHTSNTDACVVAVCQEGQAMANTSKHESMMHKQSLRVRWVGLDCNLSSKKATAKWQTAAHVLAHEEGKNPQTYSNHSYVTKTQAFQLFSAVGNRTGNLPENGEPPDQTGRVGMYGPGSRKNIICIFTTPRYGYRPAKITCWRLTCGRRPLGVEEQCTSTTVVHCTAVARKKYSAT